MVRTKRSAQLETRNKRLELPMGARAVEPLALGRYLRYQRPANGASGSWLARYRHPRTGKFTQTRIGSADDFVAADGVEVLTYAQACTKAGEWFKDQERCAHREETGQVIADGPFSVADAVEAMIGDIKRRGRDWATPESYARTRILPELGGIAVSKLTKKRIQKWLDDLAVSPRWRTGRGTSEAPVDWGQVKGKDGKLRDRKPTADQLRARQATANRILAVLKRALNFSVEEGRYDGAMPWRDVAPFKGVAAARVRFLSRQEQIRLINACEPDFRRLVEAALLTGSRYAPLCRLQVRDFNPKAGTVWIARDKGRGADSARHVVLNEEGVAWFKAHTAGKKPNDLILTREGVVRTTREAGDGAWQADDQRWQMAKACKAAKLESLTFHELRHTYASGLVNEGVPLVFVAQQLGHKGPRMVEKHYGHLAPSALTDSIRNLSPVIGLEIPQVALLKTRKRA